MTTDKDKEIQPKEKKTKEIQHVVRVVPVGAQEPEEVSRKDRYLILTIIVLLCIVAILAVVGFLTLKPGPDVVQGQGEATEVRVSGKLPGRVTEIFVEEGQRVHAGDTIAHITSKLADAQYSEAEALEQIAQAGQKKVDSGTRIQIINTAEAALEQAKSANEIAGKTYRRMEALYAKGVVSAQRRDEAASAYKVTQAGVTSAQNALDLARSGAQSEDKDAAGAMVKAAQSGKAKVDALLDDQYLTAPYDGEIVTIYPHTSELVATGAPIATLQIDDHWAVFNVRETLLKDIRLGTKLKVYIPALDMDTEMKVFYIRDLGTYANWQATKATGDYDARTFKIKARPEKKIDGFRPGMSVVYKGIAK